MPVAVGWHPWFRRSEDADMRVAVDAAHVLVTGDDLIPTGEVISVRATQICAPGPSWVTGDSTTSSWMHLRRRESRGPTSR